MPLIDPDNPEDPLWTAEDCQAETHISAGTWRYWASIANPRVPSFKVGRRRVWRSSTVKSFMRAPVASVGSA